MKNDDSFPIETKYEAWAAVIISMLFIICAAIFVWLYCSSNRAEMLIGVFSFGIVGFVIIPQSVINLKNTYSAWKKLEPYIEKYYNLELAESDEYAIDTSTHD